jgi:hypothetical protein
MLSQYDVFFKTERISQILLTMRIASLAQKRDSGKDAVSNELARAAGRVGIE